MSQLGKSSGTGGPPVRLGDIAKARMGKTILSKELTEAGVPVYSAGRDNEPWGYVPSSDLLFGEETIVIAARGNIGFPRVPRITPFVSTQTTIAISFKDSRHVPYLRYQLETVNWPGMTSQTTIPMVTVRQVEGIEVRLPHLDEQRRIVAEIEKQFTRLEAGVAALRRVQANLKRYRAAVLKAAFSAELVETDNHQPWESRPLADLVERMHQGINTAADKIKYQESGYKILQAKHITSRKIDASDARFVSQGDFESYKERYCPRANQILLTNIGTIGKSVVVRDDANFLIAWNVFLIDLRPLVIPKFLQHYFDFLLWTGFYQTLNRGNATQFINKRQLSTIQIPLPPLAEQTRIVAEVERRLSVVEELESVVTANLQRATRLRQSILQKAFTGELIK